MYSVRIAQRDELSMSNYEVLMNIEERKQEIIFPKINFYTCRICERNRNMQKKNNMYGCYRVINNWNMSRLL